MSLGGGVQGPHDYLAEAVNAAVDAGVVVAVAAGNSGPGDMTVESPGSAAKAITVGASTNAHYIGIPVTAGGRSFGPHPWSRTARSSDVRKAPFCTPVVGVSPTRSSITSCALGPWPGHGRIGFRYKIDPGW